MKLSCSSAHFIQLSIWSCSSGWAFVHISSKPLAFEESPRTSAIHWNCSGNVGAKVPATVSNESCFVKHCCFTWALISRAISLFLCRTIEKFYKSLRSWIVRAKYGITNGWKLTTATVFANWPKVSHSSFKTRCLHLYMIIKLNILFTNRLQNIYGQFMFLGINVLIEGQLS